MFSWKVTSLCLSPPAQGPPHHSSLSSQSANSAPLNSRLNYVTTALHFCLDAPKHAGLNMSKMKLPISPISVPSSYIVFATLIIMSLFTFSFLEMNLGVILEFILFSGPPHVKKIFCI